jgi:type IV secretion system protein VirB9
MSARSAWYRANEWAVRCTASAMLLATCLQIARADVTPAPGEADGRIRTAIYRSDQVYRLTGRLGYALDLEFAAEERFVGLATGDVQGVGFEAQANHLFIKPKAERVATNLAVLTTRHQYYLDYSVQSSGATPEGMVPAGPSIYAVRFLYPDEERQRTTADAALREEQRRIADALQAVPAVINRHYAFCGPQTLKPRGVSDDGVRTTFTFDPRSELPAVFVRSADGAESLVNFTVTQDGLTVHRIAERFILRRGRLVGCVVNQAYDGGGSRLSSGTVSPQVQRVAPQAPDQRAEPDTQEAAR